MEYCNEIFSKKQIVRESMGTNSRNMAQSPLRIEGVRAADPPEA